MLQAFIAGDALQLVLDNLLHLVLDAVVVLLHLLLHAVVALLVREKILRPMEYVKSLKSLLPPTANRITSYLPTMNKDVYKNTHCIKKSPVRKKQNT